MREDLVSMVLCCDGDPIVVTDNHITIDDFDAPAWNRSVILGELGAGGRGLRYRGNDTRLNRPVAIKVLPAAVAGDPERREAGSGCSKSSSSHGGLAAMNSVAPDETDVLDAASGRR